MGSGANHGGGDQKGTAMSTATAWPDDRRITIRDLQAATDRGERWSMLTSYDTLTAGVLEAKGRFRRSAGSPFDQTIVSV
jgi:hypothetical protein